MPEPEGSRHQGDYILVVVLVVVVVFLCCHLLKDASILLDKGQSIIECLLWQLLKNGILYATQRRT